MRSLNVGVAIAAAAEAICAASGKPERLTPKPAEVTLKPAKPQEITLSKSAYSDIGRSDDLDLSEASDTLDQKAV